MTVLSKIKTIIGYAKFGMVQSILYNKEPTLYELHFPKSITSYYGKNNNGWQKQAKAITGHLQVILGEYFILENNNVEIIDLPELISASGHAMFHHANGLRICKIPKIRTMSQYFLSNCPKLEYLEIGSLDNMYSNSLQNATSLTTLIVGEGTRSNLYLYQCPNLTQECLHNIIDNLADMVGLKAPTFYVGENLAKIAPEYLTKLTKKIGYINNVRCLL